MAKKILIEVSKAECKTIAEACDAFMGVLRKYKSKAAKKQYKDAEKIGEDFKTFVKNW